MSDRIIKFRLRIWFRVSWFFCPTYFTTFETNQIKEKQRHVSRFYAHYQNNKCSGKDESCKSRDSMIHRGMDLKYKRYQRSYIPKIVYSKDRIPGSYWSFWSIKTIFSVLFVQTFVPKKKALTNVPWVQG